MYIYKLGSFLQFFCLIKIPRLFLFQYEFIPGENIHVTLQTSTQMYFKFLFVNFHQFFVVKLKKMYRKKYINATQEVAFSSLFQF